MGHQGKILIIESVRSALMDDFAIARRAKYLVDMKCTTLSEHTFDATDYQTIARGDC